MKEMLGLILTQKAHVALNRKPDFIIRSQGHAVMARWRLISKPWFGVYVHEMLANDPDKEHHDHPWPSLSYTVMGAYRDNYMDAKGNIKSQVICMGEWKFRRAKHAHRLDVIMKRCVTVFIRGPVIRNWGFHCPKIGFVRWQDYVAATDKGSTGKGCNQ